MSSSDPAQFKTRPVQTWTSLDKSDPGPVQTRPSSDHVRCSDPAALQTQAQFRPGPIQTRPTDPDQFIPGPVQTQNSVVANPVHTRPSSDPGPVQTPDQFRPGPVQIRTSSDPDQFRPTRPSSDPEQV